VPLTSDVVEIELAEGIQRITLNRPAKKNALTREMLLRLREALEVAASNQAVRVVAITGAGTAFSAGQDLSERDPRTIPNWPLDLAEIQAELYHPILHLMRTMPKPVVAIVPGVAAGAGAGLALAADIVLASQSAQFSFSFVKVGLSVDAGLGWVLTRCLGPARARGILMMGQIMSAQEAATSGLIWRVVADVALATTAEEVLKSLCDAPQQALRSIKASLAQAEGEQLHAYLQHEAKQQGLAGADPDYAEGVLAFLEKRKPNFA
jgi:2-(1,2-epoxy-1,2-dihydrophenyl)acetyl-CoA isomerase